MNKTNHAENGHTVQESNGRGWSIGMLAGGVAAGVLGSRLLPPLVAALTGSVKARAGADPFQLLMDDHREILALLDEMLALPEPPRARRPRLYLMLKRKLAKHALAEEDIVYPIIRSNLVNGDERGHLYHEHADMKILLYQLEDMLKSGEDWTETVGSLRSLIRSHIEEEENTIFPELRRELHPTEWPKISGQISREEAMLL